MPVVTHCGSGPVPGRYTGPGPVAGLLARHPRLRLVVAHLGMPEYSEFLDLAERYEGVLLDTTMAFTPFIEGEAPFPAAALPRLRDLGDRVLLGTDFPNIPLPVPGRPGVAGAGRARRRVAARGLPRQRRRDLRPLTPCLAARPRP